jgi:hypothetical protein
VKRVLIRDLAVPTSRGKHTNLLIIQHGFCFKIMFLHNEKLCDSYRLKIASYDGSEATGILRQGIRTTFNRQKCTWMTKEGGREKLQNVSCEKRL